MADVIQVYCKAPVVGSVKTRLIPDVGAEAATKLHEQLAQETIADAINAASQLSNCQVQLWCAPDVDHPFFQSFAAAAALCQQQGADLGQRMFAGATAAFTDGADHVMVIGTDCPPVDAAFLVNAMQVLATCDAVIAPAEDGGYGLLGLAQPSADLFTGIHWGSNTVFQETSAQLDKLGWRWQALPEIWDVDRIEDVRRYESLAH